MKLLARHPLICAQISQSQREILLSKRAEKKKERKTERLSINIFLHTSTEYYDIYFWHTAPYQNKALTPWGGTEQKKKKRFAKRSFCFFYAPIRGVKIQPHLEALPTIRSLRQKKGDSLMRLI